MIPFIFTNDGRLTVFLNGTSKQINKDHPNYRGVVEALRQQDVEELNKLINQQNVQVTQSDFDGFDSPITVKENSDGSLTVKFNGHEIHNSMVERLKELKRQGLPIDGMVKFLHNMYENPSSSAIEEGYDFLSNKGLPITEDGCFIAWKAVNGNYYDKYSNTIYNGVGKEISMPRQLVDDNRRMGCSKGLHVGALDYVYSYGSTGDRIIVTKVNPRDIVSVPEDCHCQKLRCCRYKVIDDYDSPIESPLTDAAGRPHGGNSKGPHDIDWSFADDNYDDWDDDYFSNDWDDDYYNPEDVTSE